MEEFKPQQQHYRFLQDVIFFLEEFSITSPRLEDVSKTKLVEIISTLKKEKGIYYLNQLMAGFFKENGGKIHFDETFEGSFVYKFSMWLTVNIGFYDYLISKSKTGPFPVLSKDN